MERNSLGARPLWMSSHLIFTTEINRALVILVRAVDVEEFEPGPLRRPRAAGADDLGDP